MTDSIEDRCPACEGQLRRVEHPADGHLAKFCDRCLEFVEDGKFVPDATLSYLKRVFARRLG